MQNTSNLYTSVLVAPLVGAWIEIYCTVVGFSLLKSVAPLVGAWIEIVRTTAGALSGTVAPLVGAWIEMSNKYLANS